MDIRRHMYITLFQLVDQQNRHKATHKLDFQLVIAGGHFNLPQGFVQVCMG